MLSASYVRRDISMNKYLLIIILFTLSYSSEKLLLLKTYKISDEISNSNVNSIDYLFKNAYNFKPIDDNVNVYRLRL